jgi:hypothetical protein
VGIEPIVNRDHDTVLFCTTHPNMAVHTRLVSISAGREKYPVISLYRYPHTSKTHHEMDRERKEEI